MSRRDFSNLFAHLDEMTLGFSPLFRQITESTHYPPHNIVNVTENEFILELALAGFKKSEIAVTEDRGLLTVAGEKNGDYPDYQYKGIATRSFKKSLRIAEDFKIDKASLEDGILSIRFIKDELKIEPKLITIS